MGDLISLPQGGGAIRSIGETFQPDPHMGTGNFTVPLELPPGRGALAPKLALSYSSASGNGPFGLGWQLPIPGVRRKTEKRLPRYDDSDIFVISGAEDLVAVQADTTAGVSRYRPKSESLFARIEHHTRGTDHWTVWTKEGLVSTYGTSRPADAPATWHDPAAIYDPDDPARVADWLLTCTVNTFGNRIDYAYISDPNDPAGAQRYLSQVGYADYIDPHGDLAHLVHVRLAYEARTDVHTDRRRGFAVSTGLRCSALETWTNAETVQKTRVVEFAYSDATSRPADNGVSLLTAIRVVGYDGDATQAMAPLEFGYSGWDPGNRRYQAVGGDRLPAQALSAKGLDLVDLFGKGLPDVVQLSGGFARYWRNEGDATFGLPRQFAATPAGVDLASPDVRIMDADGDGRPDVLVATGSAAGYFPISSDATFAPRDYVRYPAAPSFGLSDQETRLIDLDGDGIVDALRLGAITETYFNEREDGWRASAADLGSPLRALSFSDPRVKLADMTGDGLTDIVFISNGIARYWPNLGFGSFGAAVTMIGAPVFEDANRYGSEGFDPARLLLGDVDGDGCADVVYVGHRSTTVWVNRAGGGFAPPVSVPGTPYVDDSTNVRLTDLLGTGTSGVLWTLDSRAQGDPGWRFLDFTGGIKPYLLTAIDNHMGGRTAITYAPSTAYAVADALAGRPWRTTLPFPVQVVASMTSAEHFSGNSTTTTLDYHHGYWDGADREFRGFARVERYDTTAFDPSNGLAAEHYCPPTMLRSWFHVGPVGSEADWIELDLGDEYWSGDLNVLGIGDRSKLPAGLSRRQLRDVVRALRGKLLRSELYGLDDDAASDRPYTVTEHCYDVVPLSDAFPGAVIVSTPSSGERTTQWERGNDPMTQISFTAGFDDYGNARLALHIAAPRGRDITSAGEPFLATLTTTEHAARDDATRYICDRVASAKREEILDDGKLGLAQFRDAIVAGGGTRRILGLHRVFYDGAPFVGLAAGMLGDHGLPKRTATLVIDDATLTAVRPESSWAPYLDGAAWADEYPAEFRSTLPANAGFVRHDGTGFEPGYYATSGSKHDIDDGQGRGLTVVTRDALGHDTTISYDPYEVLPACVTDAVGLTHSATYDYRTLKPSEIVDSNGNVSRATYSPLGLTAWTASVGKPGKNEGDTAEQPGVMFSYGLTAFDDSPDDARQATWTHTTRRVDHRWTLVHDANTARAAAGQPLLTDDEIAAMFPADEVDAFPERFLQSRVYNDGAGRLLQTRALADDLAVTVLGLASDGSAAGDLVVGSGGANAARVVVSGLKAYDNKGNIIKAWEPRFDSGWEFAPPGDDVVAQLACVVTHYDPRGRAIQITHPDGSVDLHVFGVPVDLANPSTFVPTPWERYDYDRNDNGGRTHPESAASWSSHWNTPVNVVLDALGRIVSSTRRMPGVESTSRNEYDIVGNLVRATDPLGRVIATARYDLRGHAWRSTSIDAGTSFSVVDAGGGTIEHRDAKGTLVLTARDAINRAAAQWSRDKAGAHVTLRTVMVYGDDAEAGVSPDDAAAGNLLGRAFRAYDEAGVVETSRYDLAGNPLTQRRQVFSVKTLLSALPTGTSGWDDASYLVDWQPPDGTDRSELARTLLDPASYETDSRWDAVGRRVGVVAPLDAEGKRRAIDVSYAHNGKLRSLAVDGVDFVSMVAYDARDQRVVALHGNGVLTRYAYDSSTFRLNRQHSQNVDAVSATTWRPRGAILLDQSTTYDLVGNPLGSTDRAPGSGVPGDEPDSLARMFSYDALYRLVSATGREHVDPLPAIWSATPRGFDVTATRAYSETYGYDLADNLLTLGHKAGNAGWTRDFSLDEGTNRVATLTISGTSFDYGYDACGNLMSETDSRHFTWDAANRLASFRVQATETAPPSQFTQYHYDSTGARVLKLTRNQGGTCEISVYPGGPIERLILIDAANTATTHDELHITDGAETIAVVRIGQPLPGDQRPATGYHLTDRLGSGVALVDETRELVSREEYSPYGETTFGSCAKKRYRFTGRERDEESGLSYHVARYYAPWLARWISCDPLGIKEGPSLFAYAHGNPLRLVDTNGMSAAVKLGPHEPLSAPPEAPTPARPALRLIKSTEPLEVVGEAGGVEAGGAEIATAGTSSWTAVAAPFIAAAGSLILLGATIRAAINGSKTPIDVADDYYGTHFGDMPGWIEGDYAKKAAPAAHPSHTESSSTASHPHGATTHVVTASHGPRGDEHERAAFRTMVKNALARGCPQMGLSTHPLADVLSLEKWDAGHTEAFKFGGMGLAVELRGKNRSSGKERAGVNEPKQAIDICGIPIMLDSAREAVREGLLDPEFVIDAKPSEGWQPGSVEHLLQLYLTPKLPATSGSRR